MTLFSNSSSLVDNAWRDLERRGVPVTATRDSGWKWWSSQQATVQVQALTFPPGLFCAWRCSLALTPRNLLLAHALHQHQTMRGPKLVACLHLRVSGTWLRCDSDLTLLWRVTPAGCHRPT